MSFKPMLNIVLSITLLSSITAFAITKVTEGAVFAPRKFGSVELFHSNDGFTLVNKGKTFKVPSHSMDANLRRVTEGNIEAMVNAGYIDVRKFDNGEFCLRYNVRGNGGGLLGATATYFTVKVVGSAAVGAAGGVALASAYLFGGGPAGVAMSVGAVKVSMAAALVAVEAGAQSAASVVAVAPTP